VKDLNARVDRYNKIIEQSKGRNGKEDNSSTELKKNTDV
jgi:hypothetical protein